MSIAPLSGIRVIDLTHYIAGPYCTKLFADMGADVIKIEKPGRGDGARWLYPFAGGNPHPEKSLSFLYLNTNKRSVILDLKSRDGIQKLKELVKRADILVENFRPGVMAKLGIDYKTMERLNPHLVITSISNFGQDGPYRDFAGTELTLSAFAGMMYMTGRRDREPVKLALYQMQYTTGVTAAIATLAAHRHSRNTGTGQHVDISIVEPMLNNIHQQTARYGYWGTIQRRDAPDAFPTFVETNDGWLHLSAIWISQLIDFVNIPQLDDPKFRDLFELRKHASEIRSILLPWFNQRSKIKMFHDAQLQGIPLAPVHDEGDLLNCPQLEAREYFVEVDHPVAGRARYPGRYFVSDQIEPLKLRPAPLLGEHTEEVLGQLSETSTNALAYSIDTRNPHTMPLAGVRILTPEHWAALPHATKYLASLGAQIITVERPARPSVDPTLRIKEASGGLYNEGSRNKLAITLDLSKPLGIEIFKRLVKISDIVADNFTPRVMKNLGLDYDELRKVKPDIIVLSMSGYGHRGPWYLYRGYATSNEAACGVAHLTGYPDGPPQRPGGTPFGDIIPALHACFSVLSALEHHNRTGEGAFIDLGMLEPCTSQLAEAIINYSYTIKSMGRMGNRELNAAPSGCYRCLGEDKWVAIACHNENQWKALIKELGNPQWTAEKRFHTLESREKHQDELDRYIEAWTVKHNNTEIMRLLQAAGIPSGAVLNVPEVMTNEHLLYRGAYEVVQHPQPPEGAGNRLHLGTPWKLSRTPASTSIPAPAEFGKDNDYVFRELLGLTDKEIAEMEAQGIFSTEAEGPPRLIYTRPEMFGDRDEGFLQKLGLE